MCFTQSNDFLMELNVENSSSVQLKSTIKLTEDIYIDSKRKQLKKVPQNIFGEKAFKILLQSLSVLILLLVIGILFTLFVHSIPSLKAIGLKFLWIKTWDPPHNVYGTLPFLIGTLITSFTALLISVPFSIGVAITLGEYFPNGAVSNFIKNAIDLIAAVPSVIFGFWGFLILVPYVRDLELRLGITPPDGQGLFTASLVLAVMIVPYAASLGTTMIKMTPSALKEAAYALGATRWEVLRNVILPYSKSGIYAGILLSLGRAVGETMAVTLVVGSAIKMPKSIFSTGNTMSSMIANQFSEASSDPLQLSSVIEIGLILFMVTFVINYIGKKIITRFSTK